MASVQALPQVFRPKGRVHRIEVRRQPERLADDQGDSRKGPGQFHFVPAAFRLPAAIRRHPKGQKGKIEPAGQFQGRGLDVMPGACRAIGGGPPEGVIRQGRARACRSYQASSGGAMPGPVLGSFVDDIELMEQCGGGTEGAWRALWRMQVANMSCRSRVRNPQKRFSRRYRHFHGTLTDVRIPRAGTVQQSSTGASTGPPIER